MREQYKSSSQTNLFLFVHIQATDLKIWMILWFRLLVTKVYIEKNALISSVSLAFLSVSLSFSPFVSFSVCLFSSLPSSRFLPPFFPCSHLSSFPLPFLLLFLSLVTSLFEAGSLCSQASLLRNSLFAVSVSQGMFFTYISFFFLLKLLQKRTVAGAGKVAQGVKCWPQKRDTVCLISSTGIKSWESWHVFIIQYWGSRDRKNAVPLGCLPIQSENKGQGETLSKKKKKKWITPQKDA